MEDWLKTTDAARLAGVGTTAIKRWADEGRLACRRTPGGHRRYRRQDLLEILADDYDRTLDRWVQLACTAGAAEFEAELQLARARDGAWFRIAETLGKVIARIGDLWSRGALSIVEEHRASARIHRALANISDRMVVAGAVTAVLVNAPGDPHTLGLSLAEIVLREADFDTLWLGARVPASEFEALLADTPVALIAASASAVSTDTTVLRDFASELLAASAPHGTRLVLGGLGAWPDLPGTYRFRSWDGFSDYAKTVSGSR